MSKYEIKSKKSEYYTNRELSWLEFNQRVLGEAQDDNNPLFERLKFLGITASNLDEFYMVRAASLKDQVNANYTKTDIAGLTPSKQLSKISLRAHEFVADQYNTYHQSLLPLLHLNHIEIVPDYESLTTSQSHYVDEYFAREIYPVLTPMAVDSSRPFPLLRNKSLNICAWICDKKNPVDYEFATVQVPSVLPRFLTIPNESSSSSAVTLILLEQVIEKNLKKLFLNYDVVCAFPYRITRNADLSIEEEEAADLLTAIQKQLKKRQWGQVIRLEVEEGIKKKLLKRLKKELSIKEDDIFSVPGPLDLTYLFSLTSLSGYDHLKFTPYVPVIPANIQINSDLFAQIRRQDLLLHHPYHSFHPVIEFIRQASVDDQVLAIKQTLYRVSSNSPIIHHLAAAAENGKQVTVLVELKARFDEENNILWAKKLEQAGCHVIYGLKGLKTHCKITLVVRKEDDGIRRYVHLATGNYNDSTAKLYTDLGVLTCRRTFGEDASALFNMLSGYSEPPYWNKLCAAPYWLRDKFLFLIRRERDNALAGRKAHIIAKMNSLCDPKLIMALYEASAAGVHIDLIIRGICCLKVNLPRLSENITVRSIVSRFLEHSRIFYFYNNGCNDIYLGSADWMPRNLDKRVELLFPLEDIRCKQEILHILQTHLSDTAKAHRLLSNGTYEKIVGSETETLNSQYKFCQELETSKNTASKTSSIHRFEPQGGEDHKSS